MPRTPYATYEYYTKEYGGKMFATDSEFLRYEKKAARWIDYRTSNRAVLGTQWDDDLKEATCAIAEILQEEDSANLLRVNADSETRRISSYSESIDGVNVSESYENSKTDTATVEGMQIFEDKRETTIRQYLIHTGWLFAGIGR